MGALFFIHWHYFIESDWIRRLWLKYRTIFYENKQKFMHWIGPTILCHQKIYEFLRRWSHQFSRIDTSISPSQSIDRLGSLSLYIYPLTSLFIPSSRPQGVVTSSYKIWPLCIIIILIKLCLPRNKSRIIYMGIDNYKNYGHSCSR